MQPNLFHIYGPLYVNCYGLAIIIGILLFVYLIQKNQNFKKLISIDQFNGLMFYSIIISIVGGRILWAISDWNSIQNYSEILALWEPGYSSLGSIIALLIFVPIYLKKNEINAFPLLDIVAIYAPLLHAVSRIGCFFAGCCHGIPTNSIFGFIYTHPDVAVPNKLKFIKIHPTQLYSSISLFFIFFLMYFIFKNKFKKNGQLLTLFLIFSSLERFFNDFYRADREFYNIQLLNCFSINQWLALIIFISSVIIFININFNFFNQKNYPKIS